MQCTKMQLQPNGGSNSNLAFFWLALRTLTFLELFEKNYNKTKS